jgi:hypothetical protein
MDYPPMDYYDTGKGKFIELFSNPEIVRKKAREYGLEVVYSPRKNKKYRIVNPETNKFVDFGSIYYEDHTKHQNLKRLEAFKKRNRKWKDAPKYSSAWASYHLLW